MPDRSLEYLDFVRTQPCICTMQPAEACHLKHIGRGIDKSKPNPRHFTAVPMTHEAHMDWHTMTKAEFEQEYNVNVWQENVRLLIRFLIGEEMQ